MPQKNELQPWRSERFCIPEKDRARFVARREAVLDAYQAEYDRARPLICMDETSKAIHADVVDPVPMSAGHPRREDDHYERKGVQSIFCFVDPLAGWRRVSARDTRTRLDWAAEVRQLLDVDYPHAEVVTLVCDNLNTHDVASLYTAFDPVTAHRLARRLRIVHTPRNGSWLNIAEIELSVLSRQCLDRRFADAHEMASAIAAWMRARNAGGGKVNWRFRTADARVRLRRLYPVTPPDIYR